MKNTVLILFLLISASCSSSDNKKAELQQNNSLEPAPALDDDQYPIINLIIARDILASDRWAYTDPQSGCKTVWDFMPYENADSVYSEFSMTSLNEEISGLYSMNKDPAESDRFIIDIEVLVDNKGMDCSSADSDDIGILLTFHVEISSENTIDRYVGDDFIHSFDRISLDD